jgi:predicted small secreted protein
VKKLLILSLAVLGFSLGAAACNTVRGAGEDVQAAGRGVQNASEEAEEELNKEF